MIIAVWMVPAALGLREMPSRALTAAFDWPMAPTVISEKDAAWPDFKPEIVK